MSDYISREAFLAEQLHLYCENCARRKGMKNGKMKFVYEIGDAPCRACGIGDVLDDVENFPAADVRPNVPGHWIYKPYKVGGMNINFPSCSECGYSPFVSMYYAVEDMHYCPNCGAYMGEEI